MIGSELKSLRQQSGMSVRTVAHGLGYEAHSKYAYYESPRFKGPLPLDLARRLAGLWEYRGVEPIKVLELAGLNREDAIKEHSAASTLRHQETLRLEVLFPDEFTLMSLLEAIFEVIETTDLPTSLAEKIAFLLPIAIQNAPSSRNEDFTEIMASRSFVAPIRLAWQRRAWLYEDDTSR